MAKVFGMSKSKISEAELTELIKAKAKELWERKGRPQGQDLAIWLEAERSVKSSRA